MRFLSRLFFLALLGLAQASAETTAPTADSGREFIIVTGGPALRYMEHGKAASHDMYWFNFIDASVIRGQELRPQLQPGDHLTWLVYRPSYAHRSAEMGKDLLGEIMAKATSIGANLFWFNNADELINYLNKAYNRKKMPIANFDYFGHSNKACFLFDYSNTVDGLSVDNLHVTDLKRINANIFDKTATCKSWGCHSGELYSEWWRKRFNVAMEGAIGKTDFSHGGIPVLSDEKTGKWVR